MQLDRPEDTFAEGRTRVRRIPAGLAALVALSLIQAGCAGQDGQPPAGEAASPDAVAEDATLPSADLYDPAGLSGAPSGDVAVLPPVDDDPKQLLGLDRDALNEKLGEPTLVRRDGDAEVWQYRAEHCVLDLFLYGSEKKVEHVDLRDREKGDELSVRKCFADMLRERLLTS